MRIFSKKIFFTFFLVASFFCCIDAKAQFETKKYVAFSYIYNSLRYFQPTISSKKIDWDNFAVYGLKSISTCKNPSEFIDSINSVFSSINSVFICSSKSDKLQNYHKQNCGERYYFEHNGLGTGCNSGYTSKVKKFDPKTSPVKDTLIILSFSEHNIYFKFPILVNQVMSELDSLKISELNSKINTLSKLESKEFTTSFRIANAVIIWGIFKNFYPYRNDIKYNWDEELGSFIEKVKNIKEKDHYLVELKTFISKYNDGHIILNSYSDTLRGYYPSIELKLFNDDIYISKALDTNISNLHGLKVLKIENISTQEYLKKYREQVSASTKENQNYRLLKRILEGGKKSSISITAEDIENREIEIRLTRDLTSKEYEKKVIQYYPKFKKLNDSVYYLNLSQVTMYDIDSLYNTLTQQKAIICDLRYYPTNNKNFLQYLLKCNDTISWIGVEQILYPNQKFSNYSLNGWYLKPNNSHISSKFYFLTTSNSISFSESYLSLIKYYKLGLIVGEKSGGTNGDYNCYNLFNQYYFYFTGARVLQLDGKILYGEGISPDILVHDDLDDLKKGKDCFVNKTLMLISNGE